MSPASKNVRSPNSKYKNASSLPDKVWCKGCSRFRPLDNFANNRQNDANFWLRKGVKLGDKRILDKIICSNCIPTPPEELTCTGCNRTRSLDKFSATQRRDPDTARCRKCISEIENVRPGQQDLREADDSDEDYKTSITGDLTSRSSTSGGVPLASSNAFVPLPSTTTNSRVPTNTITSVSSSSGFSSSTSASTVRGPAVQVGSGGFAVVKSGHREVLVPQYEEDEDVVYSDGEDWNM